jgi:UDP-N-acetylglucosamine:LPS N-acetylglucosamine transferase
LPKRTKLDFIYFDAGGGHRSAALALEAVIAQVRRDDWEVRLVNLQEVLDPLDIFRKLTGIRLEDIYNLALAKGWTLGSTYLLPCMHGVIRLYHKKQVELLRKFWPERSPDIVVSLVPNFNRALFQSLAQALPGIPLVTVLTDLADYPPHFWMERQDQFLICGTPRAVGQAQNMGYRPDRIFETSGMILRPQFYESPPFDKELEFRQLGLDSSKPTALVLFGGEGSNVMHSIAERLGNGSSSLQLIMICGRNKSLYQRLSRLRTRNKIVLEGFTKEIPRYMRMADFLIGKPGPGSISEALHMGLPVIVERNSWTLPQERYNAEWIEENAVGMVLHNFRNIDRAVKDLLAPGVLTKMKERIATMENRAVFEIPKILEDILLKSGSVQSNEKE